MFRTTEFGSLVRESALLISGGKYTECADVCRRILQYDSKYTLANIGLGKAYQAAGEYKTSLDYFYKANAAVDYSTPITSTVPLCSRTVSFILSSVLSLCRRFLRWWAGSGAGRSSAITTGMYRSDGIRFS